MATAALSLNVNATNGKGGKTGPPQDRSKSYRSKQKKSIKKIGCSFTSKGPVDETTDNPPYCQILLSFSTRTCFVLLGPPDFESWWWDLFRFVKLSSKIIGNCRFFSVFYRLQQFRSIMMNVWRIRSQFDRHGLTCFTLLLVNIFLCFPTFL